MPTRLEAEVSGSRASLGELMGAPIRGFAYPYGSMDAAARQRGTRRRLRLRMRRADPDGRARVRGIAEDLRWPARRRSTTGG